MAFIALVDGQRARCLIEPETLFALVHENALSPVQAFSEHREAVEEVARTLIQQDRLDGRELMIRKRDIEATAAPQIVPPPAATPSTEQPVEPVDGRQMTMSPEARALVWNALCDRQNEQWQAYSKDAEVALAEGAE